MIEGEVVTHDMFSALCAQSMYRRIHTQPPIDTIKVRCPRCFKEAWVHVDTLTDVWFCSAECKKPRQLPPSSLGSLNDDRAIAELDNWFEDGGA